MAAAIVCFLPENSPRSTSYPLTDRLTRGHFGELLGVGVRAFEYDERCGIHSKSAAVDGVWSTAGSP